jgi:hypothetical protein
MAFGVPMVAAHVAITFGTATRLPFDAWCRFGLETTRDHSLTLPLTPWCTHEIVLTVTLVVGGCSIIRSSAEYGGRLQRAGAGDEESNIRNTARSDTGCDTSNYGYRWRESDERWW